MIEAVRLAKRYGPVTAVDDVTFEVKPGRVTGFLGPNGAGKSTTMRLVVGLDRATSGSVTIQGAPYREHGWPLRDVGALLDARAVHPRRSARDHLMMLAAANRISRRRVDEVLELVGLESAASRRAGDFSLGMLQRLGIAGALLGDPAVLLLDEPVNGLDPDGIVWIRTLMRALAAEGRTILVSSHLMSEMALTVDHLLIIGNGRILADCSVTDLIDRASQSRVRLRGEALESRLVPGLLASGATVTTDGDCLLVGGLSAIEVGRAAAKARVVVHHLSDVRPTLEEAYFLLTSDAVAYHASVPQDVRAASA